MLCLAPPCDKTKHLIESSDISLQILSKGLSNGVLYSSEAIKWAIMVNW